jgi:chromate transporter
MNPVLHLQAADWLDLFLHYFALSLMAVGGAISTAPDMHRYLVDQQGWLTDTQFNASIALAQAAPGPNVLFIALMGWTVGLNAGGMLQGLMGAAITMFGILLPSTTLTFYAARWSHHNRQLRAVRAFKSGLAPIVVGLMLATGWLMSAVHNHPATDWPLWVVTGVSALIVWRTRIHLLWLLGAGALLGWYGLI